jgi:5-amino-6-(5-phosphoribosylamino)uracil reductase
VTTPPPLQLLWPAERAGEQVGPDDAEEALAALYAHPPGWVRANFVATLDGALRGADGRSGSINNAADFRAFVTMRSVADVVLAGAGTVRTEQYGMPKVRGAFTSRRARQGQPPAPELAVVTRTGRLPLDQGLFDGDRRALVVTCEAAGAETLTRLRGLAGPDGVIVAGAQQVDMAAALDALAERGLTRVLCEGGALLLGSVVEAGRLDELCLTWSPRMVGGNSPRILDSPPVDVPMDLVHLLHSGSTLIGRWVRTPG